MFGTVEAWLVFKLCGQARDRAVQRRPHDAVRHRPGDWDPELLELFGVPEAALPKSFPAAGQWRDHRRGPARARGATAGMAGDQQAALFGQACLEPGLAKNTYGTGSFVLQNAGWSVPEPAPGVLSTVAWRVGRRLSYALEGAVFVTGAAVQWLRDGLGIIGGAAETEQLARSLDSNDGVYFVPALTGLGSPHWDPTREARSSGSPGDGPGPPGQGGARGDGLPDGGCRPGDGGGLRSPLTELRADGGASVNAWLMQFQADVLGVPVVVPEITETTALGAAYLAGVGWGYGRLTMSAVAGARSTATSPP